MKIQITYSNDSKSTIDLEHDSVGKVSIDKGRPTDIMVRVAFKAKDTQPIDMFFPKPGAPGAPGPIYPLVSEVSVFAQDGSPEATSNPNTVYDLLSNWFITGIAGTGEHRHQRHREVTGPAFGVTGPKFNF